MPPAAPVQLEDRAIRRWEARERECGVRDREIEALRRRQERRIGRSLTQYWELELSGDSGDADQRYLRPAPKWGSNYGKRVIGPERPIGVMPDLKRIRRELKPLKFWWMLWLRRLMFRNHE